ncbi:hypothetical protein BB558_000221 [Smittium angustum]|uniref:Uncharacterized protein n=1 Tax=Smittium angustum TaxID=133377 RepID=A0A2U1JEN2_SMIAN|nr:hypothetical protein BB558_000221 [Smittium angustum]
MSPLDPLEYITLPFCLLYITLWTNPLLFRTLTHCIPPKSHSKICPSNPPDANIGFSPELCHATVETLILCPSKHATCFDSIVSHTLTVLSKDPDAIHSRCSLYSTEYTAPLCPTSSPLTTKCCALFFLLAFSDVCRCFQLLETIPSFPTVFISKFIFSTVSTPPELPPSAVLLLPSSDTVSEILETSFDSKFCTAFVFVSTLSKLLSPFFDLFSPK